MAALSDMRAPNSLNFEESNMAEAWLQWRQKLEIYMVATKSDAEENRVKIAILLNLIGQQGVSLFNTFRRNDSDTYEIILDKFEKYFMPKKNLIYERFKFSQCTQKKGQTNQNFIIELRKLAATCEFKEEENMIRDKVVVEVQDDNLREKLLSQASLTLEKTIDICNNHEVRKKQSAEMSKENEANVSTVRSIGPRTNKGDKWNKEDEDRKKPFECYRCGRWHTRRACPAFGKKCMKCGGIGHFSVVCKAKSYEKKYKQPYGKRAETVEVENSEDEYDVYIDAIIKEGDKMEEWYESVEINRIVTEFKLDTGAQCNILPLHMFERLKLKKKNLVSTDVRLITFGEYKIKPVGAIITRSKIKRMNVNIKYVVADVQSKPLLGLNTCRKLGLIKRVETVSSQVRMSKERIIEEYKSVFEGLGTFPGRPYKIRLKKDAIPIAQPARRIARTIQPKLKLVLERLEKNSVIEKVEGPTEWLHPLVIREKPNKDLRLCLDPRYLNEAIYEERFQLPSQEEMLGELNGKTVFSVLDLKDGFHQVKLDEESAELCAFATPYGRYKFKKMPFGLKTAAEVFQRKNSELFGHIEGVKIYVDDLFIAGTEETHDEILREVLETARKAGVTFNKEKFQYRTNKIKLLGHTVTKEGIKIDPERLVPVKEMKEPTDKTQLKSFLGVVKYLGRFIPKVSVITAPLRELTKEERKWEWREEHMQAFNQLRELMTNAPVLRHFDDGTELVIQTDASKDGLGSVLLQNKHPISFASRALTDSEKRYAQIEKEMLAIIYSVEKFHYYVYGKKIKVQTDHKPLVSIVRKEINKVPARLQRMLMRLHKYDVELLYLKGSDMVIADALSRNYQPMTEKEDEEMEYVVHALVRDLPISQTKREQLQMEIDQDQEYSILKKYILKGWPKIDDQMKSEVKDYANIRDELSERNGLLLYGNRLIIPPKLRKEILGNLHVGHQGTVKMKMKAQDLVYWPRMWKDIQEVVERCEVCLMHRDKNPRQPMIPHQIPKRPWEKLAVDVAYHQGKDYLVLMDYYSKWLEIEMIREKTAKEIIKKLSVIFSTHGYPDCLISDNMPFSSLEFRKQMEQWDVKGISSSPNYPRSNGMAEKAVGIAKKLISKKLMDKGELSEALLDYRSTPIPGLGWSPAQLLLSRRLKGRVPCVRELLIPKVVNGKDVRKALEERQKIQKERFDIGTRRLKAVQPGEKVLIQGREGWRRGEVMSRQGEPRSYWLRDEKGTILRRNRQHFLPITQHHKTEKEEEKEERVKEAYQLRDRTKLKRPARFTE